MKIIFISPYPRAGGSSRFRIYQYLPFLQANGHEVFVHPFLNDAGYQTMYLPGRIVQKIFIVLSGMWRTLRLLPKIKSYDVCIVHREVALAGPGVLEWLVAKFSRNLVYDFDDAVFEPHVSSANRLFAVLKSTQKIPHLISRCHAVIAGNSYLEDYARQYCAKTFQLPTPVDVKRFVPRLSKTNISIIIGWIGSHSTSPYLTIVAEALKNLQTEFGRHIGIEIVGAGNFRFEKLEANYRPWVLEKEVSDLQGFDIGIMPMPDNRWTRGKCGFKALQYMSVGIPVVCSPVGMNRDIVMHGENGFWAETSAEWQQALHLLISDAELRKRMGEKGRRLVDERFSLEQCADRLNRIFLAVTHD